MKRLLPLFWFPEQSQERGSQGSSTESRCAYLDYTKPNSCLFLNEDTGTYWQVTENDSDTPSTGMDEIPLVGSGSASYYVDEGVDVPNDIDYWYTSAPASGYAKLPLEPLLISPTASNLKIRYTLPHASGMHIEDIYVIYHTGLNPSLMTPVTLASGYLTRYDFTQISGWTNISLPLTINTAAESEYNNLISSGIPTLEFYLLYDGATPPVFELNPRISAFELCSDGTLVIPTIFNSCTLYISGSASLTGTPASGSCTLFIDGCGSVSGEFPCSFPALGSGNNSCTLFIEGGANSGSIPLYILGDDSSIDASGSCTLFIDGCNSASGEFPCSFPCIGSGNSNCTLFITGIGSSGSIPLFIEGVTVSGITNQTTLFIEGFAPTGTITTQMNLFLKAITPASGSDHIDLFMWATTNSGLFKLTDLYLEASNVDPEYALNLNMIGGGFLGDPTNNLNLFVQGPLNIVDSGVDLFLCNNYTINSGFIPLYMRGPVGTEGAIPITGSMPLFIARDTESVAVSMSLFMDVPEPVNSGMDLYMLGGASGINNNITLVIPSVVAVPSGSLRIYLRGF